VRALSARLGACLAALALVGAACGTGRPPAAPPRTPCDDFELDVERVWNDESRRDIRAGFGNIGASYTSRAAEAVITKLDAVSRDWVMLKKNACVDTVVRKVMPRETYVALAACYDSALARQRMVISVLGNADRNVAAKSLDLAVEASRALESCGRDAVTTSAHDEDGKDPKVIEQVNQITAKATVLFDGGKWQEAMISASQAAKRAEEAKLSRRAARALVLEGRALDEMGDYAGAQERLERARAYFQGVGDEVGLASALTWLGAVAVHLGQYEKAVSVYQQGLAIVERRLGPNHLEAGFAHQGIANAFRRQGKLDDALSEYRRALAIWESSKGPDDPLCGKAHIGIGNVFSGKDQYDEALAEHRRALGIWEAAAGPEHPYAGMAHHNIAAVLEKQGKYAEALTEAKRALAIREAALGQSHPEVADSVALSGNILAALGNNEGALEAHTRALAIRVEVLGPNHDSVGTSHLNLGNVLLALRRPDDALVEFRRALAIQEAALGPRHSNLAAIHNNIGFILQDRKRYDEALVEFRLSVEILKETLGPMHRNVATAESNIAGILEDQGKLDEALDAFRYVLSLDVAALGKSHPTVGNDHRDIGRVLRLSKRFPEAIEAYRAAQSIHEAALGPSHPELAGDHHGLGLALFAAGNTAEARPELELSLKLYRSTAPVDEESVAEISAALEKLGAQP
jgi:tetratricopeptide (TPR) repeat protein